MDSNVVASSEFDSRELGFGDDAIGDVMAGGDDPRQRRVIEQVRERQRERDDATTTTHQSQIDGHGPGAGLTCRTPRGLEVGLVAAVDDAREGLTFELFLITAEQSGHDRRRRPDLAAAFEHHRDRGAVLDQRPEPGDVVAGDLPTPPLRDVANGQEDVVAERRTQRFDESPALDATDANFQQRPHVLALHRHCGDQRQLGVVGVQEIQHVPADTVGERDAEQSLGRGVAPAQLAAPVYQHNRIRERRRETSEIARERARDA